MTTDLPQIQKFNGDNFHLWKFQMKIILETKDLLSITDGSEVKPEIEDIAKFSNWKKKDAKSKMLITTALKFKYLQQIVNCQTSTEMWKKLSTIYELKSETNKYLLQQRFFEYKMNPNDSIATHISKVETLAQQMKDLGEPISDVALITKIICSLPDKYKNFITAWDSVSSEEKTLENLTARLLKEESLQDHWDYSGKFKPDNALMTFSKFNRNSRASNKQQQHQQSIKDKKKNTHCGYCKKKGHWWKECYKRKEEQKGQQPSSSARDDSCAFSAETSAFLAETKDSWIADSGATDHMTFRREWFSTFEEIPEGVHPVCLGDGKQIYVKGELIYSDVCGPMSKRSPGGSLYFVSFKDDFSRFRVAYFIRHKSDVLEKFKEFVKRVRTETGNKIKRFRTDNGTEFLNKNFSDYLKSLGIVHELTAPYTPEQNGISERNNRTIVESARCLLHGRKMPLELWAEAVNTAVYLLNRCTTKVLGNSTPYEIWYKRKPSILHLKTFGCNAYVHIPKDNRKKLDKKTNMSENIQDNQQEQVTIYSEESVDSTNTSSKPEESCRYPLRNRIREKEQSSTSCTRAISYACYVHDQEPLNYEDAIVGQDSKQWKLAMDDEFNSLMKNQTWTYVTLPSDRKAIACKWVYKIKQNADGSNKMFKARLVAKGYSQKSGLDYGETFSPVVKFDSIRTILSLCALLDMEMIQLDVKSVPSDPYSKLTKEMCPKDNQEIEEMNKIPYRQTIGSLMYLMTGTRPDIAYAVSRNCVSLSTTESEYIAASKATKEAIWLSQLLRELHQEQVKPTTIFCDNQICIRLVHNPEYHKRTKHIDISYHFIRDHFQKHAIDLLYVCSNDQAADIFTKALPPERYRRLRSQLGLFETTECSLVGVAEKLLQEARILGGSIEDEEFITTLIRGLPPKYNLVSMQFDNYPDATISDIRRIFELHEERNKNNKDKNAAYNMGHKFNKNFKKNSSDSNRERKPKCFICQKFEHRRATVEQQDINLMDDIQDDSRKITLPDDRFIKSNGIGTVEIYKDDNHLLTLKEVLYVPELNSNLISVSKITEDEKQIIFDENEAMNTYSYIKNRTPEELFTRKKPTIKHLKVFGCRAEYWIPKFKRYKFEKITKSGIFVGYSNKRKAFRICDPKNYAITETRDVSFIEKEKGAELLSNEVKAELPEHVLIDLNFCHKNGQKDDEPIPIHQGNVPESTSNEPDEDKNVYNLRPTPEQGFYYEPPLSDEDTSQDDTTSDPTYHPVDSVMKVDSLPIIPTNYEETINSPDKEKWVKAMKGEIDSLNNHKVWDVLPMTKTIKPIKSKWGFSIKNSHDPLNPIYKARFDAVECSQKLGVDYSETYSPVIKSDSLRTLIAFAAMKNLHIHHFDIETAFLYGKLEENIYMSQPKGFEYQEEASIVKRWSKAGQEKNECRGPFQEVLIEKFQRRGWQSDSPAGAVDKEGVERAAGLKGVCASRRLGSLGGEVCLVTTGPAARRTAVTTDAAGGLRTCGRMD
ncbi:hypothetical protein LAZ67_1004106 [Cordylochernes scorpioides]|uniref:Integrase catalytic domain-containing protein n=1 Tax=Cordylochernes scorpioides TaxID=51811 RepID=A0ABY6JXF3_9ARAC|nr:hypothetical protein LAZ67_1004106 [Cordylochernes scorpioides]